MRTGPKMGQIVILTIAKMLIPYRTKLCSKINYLPHPTYLLMDDSGMLSAGSSNYVVSDDEVIGTS
jgi:hypothetical protein